MSEKSPAPRNLPSVVLVHGWGGSYALSWRGSGLESDLASANRRIIALDLPGHGQQTSSHDATDYEDIADQLLALLPSEPVDAVGYSLGGKLLLEIAVRHPERIRRLVVAGVGANLFRAESGQLVSRAILATDDAEIPAALQQLVREVRRSGNDLRSLAAVICRPPRLLEPPELAKIKAGVLLVAGNDDTLIGGTEALCEYIPRSRLVLLDGVDHFGTPYSPEFQRVAYQFLQSG